MPNQKKILNFFQYNDHKDTQKPEKKSKRKRTIPIKKISKSHKTEINGKTSPSRKIEKTKKRSCANNNNFMEMEWFKNPTDINANIKSNENDQPTQVQIPPHIISRMTPATKRYFEVKTRHWDCIVFYKVGKFYELYDQDAVDCHRVLGLNYMKGETRPHVGVPEKVYEKFASRLLSEGYKIARVDQVETVKEMQSRVKSRGGPKIVARELTSMATPGANIGLNNSKDAVFLMALVESDGRENKDKCDIEIGLCFADSDTAEVKFTSFRDDSHRTRLRALMQAIKPCELVKPLEPLSKNTEKVVKMVCPEALINKREVGKSSKLLEKILPQIKPSNKNNNSTALNALRSLFQYLEEIMLAEEIIAMGKISWHEVSEEAKKLVLDGATLLNLEIFENEEGEADGTLFAWIDRTVTSFGHRKLKQWITRPLCDVDAIKDRLDAIDCLIDVGETADEARKQLKSVPDLERLLMRIQTYSIDKKKIVLYENSELKMLKIFKSVVDGLFTCQDTVKNLSEALENSDNKSKLLLNIFSKKFPSFQDILQETLDKFDLEESLRSERFVTQNYIDTEYSNIKESIESVTEELDSVLSKARKEFSDEKICYYSSTISSYQLELETATINRYLGSKSRESLPKDYVEISRTSKKRRLKTQKLEELSEQIDELEEKKTVFEKRMLRSILQKFCENMPVWSQVVKCTAQLDCLLALYHVSAFSCGAMCRPEISAFDSASSPFLELRGSWHPCVTLSEASATTEFVTNDILVGATDGCHSEFVLVTGPNMGGKSTVLRQTCVSVILAQLGCRVPAAACNFSLVDRIFTRIGANDAILANKSTFYIELEETSNILNNATNHSLVVLDELGRGTSTFDGTAIAFSVCEYLSKKVNCRTLFSTHYHLISDFYRDKNDVSQYHMSFEVVGKDVVFLYKFKKGICSESHGINCARLAGVDPRLVERASVISEQMRLRRNHLK